MTIRIIRYAPISYDMDNTRLEEKKKKESKKIIYNIAVYMKNPKNFIGKNHGKRALFLSHTTHFFILL